MKNLLKTISKLMVSLLFLCISVNNIVKAKEVRFIYLQHDAFIIQSDNRTFYFDITTKPSDTLPKPDVIFVSHNHPDHFKKYVVVTLANKSGAKVVAPQPVITALTGSLPDTQLVVFSPAEGQKVSGIISGINTTIYGSYDGTNQNSYRFEFPSGIVIYFNGDMPGVLFDQFVTMNGCNELLNMNIAMLDDWAYTISDFYTSYTPDVMIKMHMWSAASVVYTDYPTSFDLNNGNIYSYSYSNSINDKTEQENKIQIIPNPSSSSTTIRFQNPRKESYSLSVYNTKGQLIQKIQKITGTELNLDSQYLDKGLYFIKLQNANDFVYKATFIKE